MLTEKKTPQKTIECTYIGSNNPLCPLHVSAYLTFIGLQNSDALIRKHIEHIPHTQPWKRRRKNVVYKKATNTF